MRQRLQAYNNNGSTSRFTLWYTFGQLAVASCVASPPFAVPFVHAHELQLLTQSVGFSLPILDDVVVLAQLKLPIPQG